MGLSFLPARFQAPLVESVVPRMGHSGPWGRVSPLTSPRDSRGEEGRPKKTPGPRDTVPQALRRLTAEPLGCRDFAAGGAVAFEPKPRPPAAVTLAAAPRAPPRVPRLPAAPISGDASGHGCAGGPGTTLPGPARPPASLPALTLPGA